MKNTTWQTVIIVIGMVAVAFVIAYEPKEKTPIVLPPEKEPEIIVQPPEDETPPDVDIEEPLPEIISVSLLEEGISYSPSANPYDSISYKKEAIKLAVDGDFSYARVKIKGETFGEGYRFLSFNFGTESGIFKAVRKSKSRLDVEETIEKGGAFSERNPINAEVDLLGQTDLATTGSEFQAQGGTKSVRFWDKMAIDVPTVTYLLVAPFSETGGYGGASITSLEIEYICKDDSECIVAKCDPGELTTKCLRDEIGIDAMNSWCDPSSGIFN